MQAQIRPALALYGFLVLGVFLLFAPWTTVWERAVVAFLPERLGPTLMSGWTRGLVSGLGALDLAIAGQIAVEIWKDMRRDPW